MKNTRISFTIEPQEMRKLQDIQRCIEDSNHKYSRVSYSEIIRRLANGDVDELVSSFEKEDSSGSRFRRVSVSVGESDRNSIENIRSAIGTAHSLRLTEAATIRYLISRAHSLMLKGDLNKILNNDKHKPLKVKKIMISMSDTGGSISVIRKTEEISSRQLKDNCGRHLFKDNSGEYTTDKTDNPCLVIWSPEGASFTSDFKTLSTISSYDKDEPNQVSVINLGQEDIGESFDRAIRILNGILVESRNAISESIKALTADSLKSVQSSDYGFPLLLKIESKSNSIHLRLVSVTPSKGLATYTCDNGAWDMTVTADEIGCIVAARYDSGEPVNLDGLTLLPGQYEGYKKDTAGYGYSKGIDDLPVVINKDIPQPPVSSNEMVF